jgi:hypothetical protein
MSIIKPVISSVISRAVRSVLGLSKLTLIHLESTANAFFSLSIPWVASGNFNVSQDAILPTSAITYAILGQRASTANYFKVLATGYASLSIDSSIVTSTVLATKDSKFRNYGVSLSGNDFIFTESGLAIDTITDSVAAAKALTLDVFAQSNNTQFYDNVISSVKLIDLDAPSNSLPFELNELTKDYELPVNNVFGSEMVANGDFSNGTANWVAGSGSVLTANDGVLKVESPAPDTFGNAFQSINTENGKVYKVSIGKLGGAGSTNTPMGVSSTPTGVRDILSLDTTLNATTKEGSFVGDGSTVYLQLGVQGLGAAGEFSNITVRQATNFLTYVQIAKTQDVRYNYTLSNDETQWAGALQTIDIAN